MINFEKTVRHARILNPLKDFAETIIEFEYRRDPLTGRNTTVIKGMIEYIRRFLKTDESLLSSLIESTRTNCPFCPENVRSKTPMFTPDIVPEGRIEQGDVVVVPNLIGHAERSVLAILSEQHHLRLNEFTPKIFLDALNAGLSYLKRLFKLEPNERFPVFVINYLPPAGSSIVHPHMQILVRESPFFLVKLLLNKSEEYYLRFKSSYWSDLLEIERGHERYLFSENGVEWLTPFAPLRGIAEVQAVVPGRSNLLELTEEELEGIARGLSKILKFYHHESLSCFNVILLSGPLDMHLDYFDINLRVMARPGLQNISFTDAWALPYFLWDGEAVEEPEKLAERIKTFLSKHEDILKSRT
jgi:galactose-1-phosphate uridylyltransferase